VPFCVLLTDNFSLALLNLVELLAQVVLLLQLPLAEFASPI